MVHVIIVPAGKNVLKMQVKMQEIVKETYKLFKAR